MRCVASHYIACVTLHCINSMKLRCSTVRCTTLHAIPFRSVPFRSISFCSTTQHFITYIPTYLPTYIRHITLYYTTLHCITLHYITLPYNTTTVHYITKTTTNILTPTININININYITVQYIAYKHTNVQTSKRASRKHTCMHTNVHDQFTCLHCITSHCI